MSKDDPIDELEAIASEATEEAPEDDIVAAMNKSYDNLAAIIGSFPESRWRSIAITKLQECGMWVSYGMHEMSNK